MHEKKIERKIRRKEKMKENKIKNRSNVLFLFNPSNSFYLISFVIIKIK